MSYREFRQLLHQLFSRINVDNEVPRPEELWAEYDPAITSLLASPEVRDEFVSMGNGIWMPEAVEAARILQNLRQRFGPTSRRIEPSLVGRIRAEAVLRERPSRNQARTSLTGITRAIAELAPPHFTDFSRFHIEGWERVLETINRRDSLVIVAPTGSGKTEVFLMPVAYAIAQAIGANERYVPRFVLLYPRVTLLKDQLSRIFRYVFYAEQQYLNGGTSVLSSQAQQGIVIGFQFEGIRASNRDTLANSDVFDGDGVFRIVDRCPICNRGVLQALNPNRSSDRMVRLRCSHNAEHEFQVSISKNAHANTRPHILVTTAESLDRLYLNPKPEFEAYLRLLTGIIFDEVHLYFSLYGAHIYNLIRRIEELRNDQPLAKIGISATASSPDVFAAKLFHGDETHQVRVHDANDHERDPASIEVIYFLQSPEENALPGAAPTLIQSVMAMGHGVLSGNDRAIVFTESLDLVGRLERQIRNAETEKWVDNGRRRGLWEFRTVNNTPYPSFRGTPCPETSPAECPNIYLEGECWRGILGGEGCFQQINGLRDNRSLNILPVTSQQRTDFRQGDIIVATSTLEVGVDDEDIKATIHYLPPRTVFNFIQRRGRAGRAQRRGEEGQLIGETAYTLMVLGNTPSDHFYFFRRNRLVNGTYELPLNPQNRILRDMHNRLRDERRRMREIYATVRLRPQPGIWRWVWETLSRCPLLERYYYNQLQQLDRTPYTTAEHNVVTGILRRWVTDEKARLENYLSLRWLLRELEDESPIEVGDIIENALAAINGFLTEEGVSAEEVRQRLLVLSDALEPLRHPDLDPEAIERLRAARNRVSEVWDALTRRTWGIDIRHAEGLYDFFTALEGLITEPWRLRSAPDALRIVLQAMFYLHLGLEEGDEQSDCPSRLDFFIPSTYFQVVKPVVVEFRDRNGVRRGLRQEDVTSLATTLIPYKPIYRFPGQDMTVLDIEHNPDWVSDDRRSVRIHLNAEGPHREDVQTPRKIYVRPLRGDDQGQQIVRICPRCYAIHDITRRQCRCNTNLQAVKLYAEPVVDRTYRPLPGPPPRRITSSLTFLESIEGSTIIRGSDVRAYEANFIGTGYTYNTRNAPFLRFQAEYDTRLQYSIPTKGFSWNLTDVVQRLLQDADLRQQVEQVDIQGNQKILDDRLILHTAAHLLHKAIAAISGVNESLLEYQYNVGRREVVVWERYEGGAGISEIFEDALRSGIVEVYKELLASVLCPVNLAEQDENWTSTDTLRTSLAERWLLAPYGEFISSAVQEAESERHASRQIQDEESRLVCRPPDGPDGCPACIHTTYCTERNDQALAVSHIVAEAILGCFVERLSREEFEAAIVEARDLEITPPVALESNLEQGVYDVLLL